MPSRSGYSSDTRGSRKKKTKLSRELARSYLRTTIPNSYSNNVFDDMSMMSSISPIPQLNRSYHSAVGMATRVNRHNLPGSATRVKDFQMRGGYVARDFMAKLSYNIHPSVTIKVEDVVAPSTPAVASMRDRHFETYTRHSSVNMQKMEAQARAATQLYRANTTTMTAAAGDTMFRDGWGLDPNFGPENTTNQTPHARFSYRGGKDNYELLNPSQNTAIIFEIYVFSPRIKLDSQGNTPLYDYNYNVDAVNYWGQCYDTFTADNMLTNATNTDWAVSGATFTKYGPSYTRVGQEPTQFKKFNKHYVTQKRVVKVDPGCRCTFTVHNGARTIMISDVNAEILLPGFSYQIVFASRGERCFEKGAGDPKIGFAAHDYIMKRNLQYTVASLFPVVKKHIGTWREAETVPLVTAFTTAGSLIADSTYTEQTSDQL